MTKKEEILSYLSLLRPKLEKDGIDKLGLFGSYAKNSAAWGSDIDIVMNTTPRFLELHPGWDALNIIENFRSSLSHKFGVRVDICDLSGLNNTQKAKLLEDAIYV